MYINICRYVVRNGKEKEEKEIKINLRIGSNIFERPKSASFITIESVDFKNIFSGFTSFVCFGFVLFGFVFRKTELKVVLYMNMYVGYVPL